MNTRSIRLRPNIYHRHHALWANSLWHQSRRYPRHAGACSRRKSRAQRPDLECWPSYLTKVVQSQFRLFRHQRGATFRKRTFQLTSEPPRLPAPLARTPPASQLDARVRTARLDVFASVMGAVSLPGLEPDLAHAIVSYVLYGDAPHPPHSLTPCLRIPDACAAVHYACFTHRRISSSNHEIYTLCRSRARHGCSC